MGGTISFLPVFYFPLLYIYFFCYLLLFLVRLQLCSLLLHVPMYCWSCPEYVSVPMTHIISRLSIALHQLISFLSGFSIHKINSSPSHIASNFNDFFQSIFIVFFFLL